MTKKIQILGSLGNKVYVQNEEPIDAADGSVWIDLDEEGKSVPTYDNTVEVI